MRLSLVLAASFLIAVPVFAADGGPNSSGTPRAPAAGRPLGPCHDDMQKYCGNVQPGGGRTLQCIEQNKAKFSEACQKSLAEHRERFEAMEKACDADTKRLCPDTKPNEGRALRCLHQHAKDLSPGCRDLLPKRRPHAAGPAPG